MTEFNFEKLDVYHQIREYNKQVYVLVNKFPSFEQFALCSQIRRAVVSIASNVAEGVSRDSQKEKVHFISIAYGSLMETFAQLQLATDFGYINQEDLDNLRPAVFSIMRKLYALKKSYESMK